MLSITVLATVLLGQQQANLPKAPELVGNWINAEKGVKLADRKGKVTLVHYWTFGCINCKRNLATYSKWSDELAKQDVLVVGVHTPELEMEKDEKKLRDFITKEKITYPVLIDTGLTNWRNWNVDVWPTIFLVDKKGKVRARWLGELEWQKAGGTVKVMGWIKQLQAERA